MDSQGYNELDLHILKILNDNPNGLEDEILSKKLKNVKDDDKADSLNRLLSQSRITILQLESGELAYKYVDEEEAMKLKQLSQEEILIYQIIEESRDKGIWINDIKKKAGKLSSQANTITKRLEKLGFIVSHKTIKAKNRRVWMISSIEPSPEVTGGLCAEDIFDLGIMEQLGQLCIDYINSTAIGRAERKEISFFLRSQSLTKIDLTDEDIYRILNTQVFDGKLEIVDDFISRGTLNSEAGSILPNHTYRVSNWYTPPIMLSEVSKILAEVQDQTEGNMLISKMIM